MEIETGERIHFFCISFSNIHEAVGKAQTTHAYTHTHTHTHTHAHTLVLNERGKLCI